MAEKTAEFVLPKRTFSTELMVGVFAIIGILCFAYLAVNLANMRLSNAGFYEVNAEFDSVAGLKVGAPVEIAGVQIGQIEKISLNDVSAMVTMSIDNSVKLRDDDIAAIRTKGIIGDRYVKISPGGSSATVKNGDQLSDTESAVEFEEIIGKLIHKME